MNESNDQLKSIISFFNELKDDNKYNNLNQIYETATKKCKIDNNKHCQIKDFSLQLRGDKI